MEDKFEVELLEEAFEFIQSKDIKTRKKILRNINRAKKSRDRNLFKKLRNDIWEFRTRYVNNQYRLLAFWDKSKPGATLVIATHGFIKKSNKVKRSEIHKAIKIREKYFKDKYDENI